MSINARWAVGSRRMLIAVNRQIRALPKRLQDDALCEVAREMARNFDAGHTPSGTQLQGALRELRKLAGEQTSPVAEDKPRSELDALAARRSARLADAAGRERPAVGDQ